MFWVQSQGEEMPQAPQTPNTPTTPAYSQPQRRGAGTYVTAGILCAIVALFVLPEIFGTAAAVLGAYVWRLDCGKQSSRGPGLVILGIVFMLVGIYYTSLFGLYTLLP